MKIHTKTTWIWNNNLGRYVKIYDESYDYNGVIDLVCGATGQQKALETTQQGFYNQMTQQASSVFGGSSQVFQSLVNTFTPTVNAGPNQQGFNQQELSAMNSQAITNAGQGYKNAKEAVGNAEAAVGGGNVALPSGTQEGINTQLAENAANQTSSALNAITQENYAAGRQNYAEAVSGLAGAPGVFNAAGNYANAATGAGNAAANTANQVAQENNSWVNATIGALGNIGGSVLGGLVSGAAAPAPGGRSSALQTAANTNSGQYAQVMNDNSYIPIQTDQE